MPSAIPRRLVAIPGRSRPSVLQVLLRKRWRLFQVHAAVIDRRRAGGRPLVLHEKDGPAGRRMHFMLEERVGHIGYRASAVDLSGKSEFALDDVPDLREVVPVQRKGRARRVFEKSRTRTHTRNSLKVTSC